MCLLAFIKLVNHVGMCDFLHDSLCISPFFVYTMVSKINDVFWIFVQVLFGISSVEAIVTNQRIVFLVFCIFYSLCLVIVIVTKNLFSSLDVSKSIMFEIRTKELIVSYFLLCKKKDEIDPKMRSLWWILCICGAQSDQTCHFLLQKTP